MAVRIFADIVSPDQIYSDITVVIDDYGVIAGLEQGRSGSIDHDFNKCLAVPGFIDLHVHGGGGADFMDGTEESVRQVLRTHAKFGTASLLATTLTAGRDDIDKSIIAVRSVMDSPANDEARIIGIHLEGPYICAEKRGAQPLAPIRPLDIDELAHWIEISGNAIKLITIAPETAEDNGADFIKYAKERGVIVSIGHTNSTYDQAKQAIANGITHSTHLFNAMPSLHHRNPGPIAAILNSETTMVELIADGVHVHPAVIKLVYQTIGAERIILITDAISGLNMPDSTYSLGGQDVIVSNGSAKFHDGTLAGSVLTMSKAFQNIQNFTNIDAKEASWMTSSNAARHLDISSRTGSIEVGKSADIAILSPDGQRVVATMREGLWIWRA